MLMKNTITVGEEDNDNENQILILSVNITSLILSDNEKKLPNQERNYNSSGLIADLTKSSAY